MPKFHWYKRYADDALAGMMGLTLEERGVYSTVLDLIYSRDGDLPDDDRFLAGWLGCDIRIWKRIRLELIKRDKIQIIDGQIRNRRADEVLHERLANTLRSRQAGLSSGASRRAKSAADSNGNNGVSRTTVPTKRERPLNHLKREIEKPLISPLAKPTGDEARRTHLEFVARRVRKRMTPYDLDEVREAIGAGLLTQYDAWQAGIAPRPEDSPSEGESEGPDAKKKARRATSER